MRKKLIEVALPLEAINKACKADKDRKTGHIRNIHKWFAPMPLPALRALLCAAILDAPEDEAEMAQLLALIAGLVANGPDPPPDLVLRHAQDLLRRQPGSTDVWVLDPFCGGGSTLVEAQRLGLMAEGSDLNPLPVLISRALTVLPSRNREREPIDQDLLIGSAGHLAAFQKDIRRYADRVRRLVFESLNHLYPTAPNGDPVIYWWWAHTVPSPDPAFRHYETPLVTSWWLSLRPGDEQFLVPEPKRDSGTIGFRIEKDGDPPPSSKTRCLFSNAPITYEYVRAQAKEGRLGRMLLAVVSDGVHGRQHWTPEALHRQAAEVDAPEEIPSLPIPRDGLGISIQNYNISEWRDVFTKRQQRMLFAFAEAIRQVPTWVAADGGDEVYGRDIAVFLGLCLGKLAQAASTIVRVNVRKGPSKAEPAFARGDVQLNWDFAETNPFGGSVGDWKQVVTTALRAYRIVDPSGPVPVLKQADVRESGNDHPGRYVIVTDPPYFGSIGYADLSEYFYYWIRLALKEVCPELFATVGVPKLTELIASPERHGGRTRAAEYFMNGFTIALRHLAKIALPDFPVVIVYAQRQEEQSRSSNAGTGWEAMLEAVLQAELGVTGTWPISGARSARMRSLGSNSLASYIVLVCRTRRSDLQSGSRRDFVSGLRAELPKALKELQQVSIAPVDLAQAAIGPGMAVFTRCDKVLNAQGQQLSVREALTLINQIVDEALTEQEGDFDPDSRWAIGWFEQSGFAEGEYGVAETLSKAKNTSVGGMVTAGIVASKGGKVRLLKPAELSGHWDPARADTRLTAWEVVHQLIRALEAGGESAAAALVAKLGAKAEVARDLAYRLYTVCERKKRVPEALSYNGLVQSWPEIAHLAGENGKSSSEQATLFQVAGT